jgi:hypothetical protein
MTNYAFQSKEVAEALSRVGKQSMRGLPNGIAPTGAEHIYAKVPAEGIDGRSDTTCTSGVCTLVRFVTGELIEEADTNVEVYNVSETDLEPDAYIEVFRVGAFWVFASGGGGSSLKQLTATSAITAAIGLTFGTGAADILQINSGGTAYETAGLADVDIINPWEESIASGAMLTCYKEGEKYVIVQVSCPA